MYTYSVWLTTRLINNTITQLQHQYSTFSYVIKVCFIIYPLFDNYCAIKVCFIIYPLFDNYCVIKVYFYIYPLFDNYCAIKVCFIVYSLLGNYHCTYPCCHPCILVHSNMFLVIIN